MRSRGISVVYPDGVAPTELVSGLFLVQFSGSVEEPWRQILRAHGVTLLSYVPDDAFVVRCRGTLLTDLRQLPFVEWVGPYRLEHKIHAALQRRGNVLANEPAVAILLAPDATQQEIGETKRRLAILQQESHPRFGAVLRGRVAPGQWQRLVESPAVLWVEPALTMRLYDEVSSKIVGGNGTNHATLTQELGYDGRGVTVAVADSGLHTGNVGTMHPDLAGRVSALIAYGGLPNAADGHGHGTHVTGIVAGNGFLGTADGSGNYYGLGVASGANIVAQRIFDSSGNYLKIPPSFTELCRDAVAAGAQVGSHSWGAETQGNYDLGAAEFDARVRDADAGTAGDQGYVVVFSAGNAGPASQTISSPAVAKNVIAVGACQNDRTEFATHTKGREALADFSSRGPCEDGRIKPDVVAPGTWIASLRSPLANDIYARLAIDSNYWFMEGTSQAAPHVAGAAAVFIQYYRQNYSTSPPSPALVKAALIHSALGLQDLEGTVFPPNMEEGWGRVDLTELIQSGRAHEYLDQNVLLSAGEIYERSLIIAANDQPLKLTLVYTDQPGSAFALPALVNDLDLELLAPDGRIYRGNQFFQGESFPNPNGTDTINNVESIFIPTPLPGEYQIRVRARRVSDDARFETAATDQDFALVVCGRIPSPKAGMVLLDRGSYTAPGQINIRVVDIDLEGEPAVNVVARSSSQSAGRLVTLTATADAGIFTGSVATATAPGPNRLQITHNDTIRVDYFDQSDQRTNTATAIADLIPPSLFGAFVTNQFGKTIVSWQTFEAANSLVRYGTTQGALTYQVESRLLMMAHELEPTNLVTGHTYYLEVSSADGAGNADTNNLVYVVEPTATVLLVDGYTYAPGDELIQPSEYTDALEATGVSFDIWNTFEKGFPDYLDLRSYQIVIWRVNDSFNAPGDVIPSAQRTALREYVNNGGAFFMASMEILTRLLVQGGGDFVADILHVDRFTRSSDPLIQCTDCDENFGVPIAQGIGGDLIGDGVLATLDYSHYPAGPSGSDLGDTFDGVTNASPILVESVSGKACGVRFPRTGEDSVGRVVFVSFPLDAVPAAGDAPNNRSAFLRRVFQFLAPGLDGLGTIALTRRQYRIPDLVTIEVADSDLVGQSELTVNAFSSTDETPIEVVLRETPRPGLFRGVVPLISAANPPTNGQVRAFDGDYVYAEYLDASGPSLIRASNLVDTVTPVIFNMRRIPSYAEATITWETDEPTDALVQYGESVFLGRTAYSATLSTEHRVTFGGLVPDRGYFFKIVSRDAAGNTTIADTNGQPFAFDTLGPVEPFFDDFESGPRTWRVVNGAGTEYQWRLATADHGVHNGQVSAGHDDSAGTWASNLQGDPATKIDTSLISPAIDLNGGNVATLCFWHAYDFRRQTLFDDFDVGRLLVVTNSISAPIELAEYRGYNSGWERQEFDLTPYLGGPIFLIWQHQLRSFQSAYRPGWALDDVSIQVTNLVPGAIRIVNNLVQARVTLTGPATRLAVGYLSTFGNLPPGRYVATWTPVAFYQTPARQTNQLAPGGTLELTGTYTFVDANTNGMSDAWEINFFGDVFSWRKRETDSDHDGWTDYAEFIGGTHPLQTNSNLRLLTPMLVPGLAQVQIEWPTVPGREYRLETSSNLGNWVPIGNWTQATGTALFNRVSVPGGPVSRVFRVSVRP